MEPKTRQTWTEVTAEMIRELVAEVRPKAALTGEAFDTRSTEILAEFDRIAQRLEEAHYDGAFRIILSARALFDHCRGAISELTTIYLVGKSVELLNEALTWATDAGD